MKVQEKLYNRITTEPFDVQELENGVTVELHSLNQNEELYNENIRAGKFSIWTSADGIHYRLLLEDGYYERLRELHGKRVNQVWINFWDSVSDGRKKIIRRVFLPIAVLVFAIFITLMALSSKMNSNMQILALCLVLAFFIITNVIINKKIDGMIKRSNNEAIEKIKNIVGHKHFDELMDLSQQYTNEFFNYEDEEETTEAVETSEEATDVVEVSEEAAQEVTEVEPSEEAPVQEEPVVEEKEENK